MNERKMIWTLFVVLLILQLGADVYFGLRIRSMHSVMEDTEWRVESEAISARQDRIRPEVGAIQFLRAGYSIEIEAANYTQDGLALKGYIGNPTNLLITNLTLNFAAYRPLGEYRESYLKRSGPFKMDTVGEAQSSVITSLAPGTKAQFEATIPNVKQTKDGIRLTVSLFGARHGYLLP